MLYDTARTATASVTREAFTAIPGGGQVPAPPVVVAASVSGVVEDVTGKLRRERPGATIALGLMLMTEDRTEFRPGDTWTLTHQGIPRALRADTVETYRRTQQVQLVEQVHGA